MNKNEEVATPIDGNGVSKEALATLNKPVNVDDIQFRIMSISQKGYATILPYKNARYDMDILDDVVGPENWQRRYELIAGNLFCSIGINCGGQWIWKQDVGIESNAASEKGQASDASKRAAFAWGIGRELYNWGEIGVMLRADEFKADGTRGKQTWNLKLKQWKWTVERDEDGDVKRLTAKDQNGDDRYDSDKFISAPASIAEADKVYTKDDIGKFDDSGVIIVELTTKDVSAWNGKIYKGNTVYVNQERVRPIDEQLEKLKALPNYVK